MTVTQPLNNPDATLSILMHAPSKVGKTTLTGSAPKPMLMIDAEGGSKFLPFKKVHWDPMAGPPPLWDGEWEVCVVKITHWAQLANTYRWVTQAPHHFRSISLDSITETQRRCKANIKGTEQMQIQDWGRLLVEMDTIIRGFRDLTLMNIGIQVVMFVAETRQSNGKWRPYMQGQIDVSLPYWVDICGYLYTEQPMNADGQLDPAASPVRKLLITQTPQYEAGERVQGRLPGIVESPNVTNMIKSIYGPDALTPIKLKETA